jgi:hypothetical protein
MMGRPSHLINLPAEIRAELERRIAERSYGTYKELAFRLRALGFPVGVKTLQRHGHKIQQKIEVITRAAQQAQAITEVAPEGRHPIVEGVTRLLHQKVFAVLVRPDLVERETIGRLMRIAADSQWHGGFPPPRRRSLA